jgi:hypothetical protein
MGDSTWVQPYTGRYPLVGFSVMDKKGSVQSSVLLYAILMVVLILIIIIFLQFFTPYKLSNFIDSFISAGTSPNGGNLQ